MILKDLCLLIFEIVLLCAEENINTVHLIPAVIGNMEKRSTPTEIRGRTPGIQGTYQRENVWGERFGQRSSRPASRATGFADSQDSDWKRKYSTKNWCSAVEPGATHFPSTIQREG